MQPFGWVALGVIATLVGLLAKWLTYFIHGELSRFQDKLTKQFREQFQDSGLAEERLDRIEKDIEYLRGKIDLVEDYTRNTLNDLRGDLVVQLATLTAIISDLRVVVARGSSAK